MKIEDYIRKPNLSSRSKYILYTIRDVCKIFENRTDLTNQTETN